MIKLAPPESMQFGKALDKIIQKAAEANPRHGIVNLSKYNLANAFMRVGLSPSMILKLAVSPYDIAGRRPSHCSPYGSTHGLDGVTTSFLHGHRDHSRPSKCQDRPGLHPGSVSSPQSRGKYYARATYND
jgi:hypothetical protein